MAAVMHHCQWKPCGVVATKSCSHCKTTYYCSREHQALDWNEGAHQKTCKKVQSAASAGIPKPKSEKPESRDRLSEIAIQTWKGTLEIDPQCAYAYSEIAFQLYPSSTTMIKGKLWSAFDLLKHSISLNSNFVGPLIEMALHILPDQSVDIEGFQWTKVKLYTKAIALDPNYFVPYHNLAVVLPPDGKVKIGEREWTKQDLFQKARELIPPGDEIPPLFMEVRARYIEKDDAQWRKKVYREEVWGDQSLSDLERMERRATQDFNRMMQLKKTELDQQLKELFNKSKK